MLLKTVKIIITQTTFNEKKEKNNNMKVFAALLLLIKLLRSTACLTGGCFMLTTSGTNVTLWETASRQQLFVMNHGEEVYEAVYSPDAKFAATVGDAKLRLWSLETGVLLWSKAISAVCFLHFISPAGLLVAVSCGSTQGTDFFEVFNVNDGLERFSLSAKAGCYFHSKNKYIVEECGDEKGWRIVDAEHFTWNNLQGSGFVIVEGTSCVKVSADDKYLATGCFDVDTNVWDVLTGNLVFRGVSEIHFSPALSRECTFATLTYNKVEGYHIDSIEVRYCNNGQLKIKKDIDDYTNDIALLWSPEGRKLLYGDFLFYAIFDVETGVTIQLSSPASKNIFSNVGPYSDRLAFSPDGSLVAGSGYLWSTSDGSIVRRYVPENGIKLSNSLFSADGSRVLFSSYEGTKLCDTRSSKVIRSFGGYDSSDNFFSPDGRIVFRDPKFSQKTKFLDSVTGQEIPEFSGLQDPVFSPPTEPVPTSSPTTTAPTSSPTEPQPSASPTTSIPTTSPTSQSPTQSPSMTPTASPTPILSCASEDKSKFCICEADTFNASGIVESADPFSCHFQPFKGHAETAFYTATIVSVLFALFGLYGLWTLRNGRMALDLLFEVFGPIADLSTDVYYVLTATFHSTLLFYLSIVFLLLPLPYSLFWMYKNSKLNIKRKNFNSFYKVVVMPILILNWTVLGFALFQTKLLAFIRIKETFRYGWNLKDNKKRVPEDNPEVPEESISDKRDGFYGVFDVELFHKFRLVEVICESAPMVVIQLINAISIGALDTVTIVSFTFSSMMVVNVLYVFVFQVGLEKRKLHEVSLGFHICYDRNSAEADEENENIYEATVIEEEVLDADVVDTDSSEGSKTNIETAVTTV